MSNNPEKRIVFIKGVPAYLGSQYLIAIAFGRLVVDEVVVLESVSPEGIATVQDGEKLTLPFEYLCPVMKALPLGLVEHLMKLVDLTNDPSWKAPNDASALALVIQQILQK